MDSTKYQTQDKGTRQVKVTRVKTRYKTRYKQDKTRQDTRQDKTRQDKTEVWETEKRKGFEGLQVGDALYIEEIQIPHKTLTTYTDRYTQCGVITCITTKIT